MGTPSRRTWVKLHVTGWLHGSIRWQFTSEERGVWADLIALAGEIGQNGAICDNDGRPLPREFIANQLNIKQILLDRVIAKCRHEGRIADTDNAIELTNWPRYQSEYDRQKKYRGERKKPAAKPGDLEAFTIELKAGYPELNVDSEVKSCQLWWSESGKQMKKPKLALKNWMDKAMQIKKESEAKNGLNKKANQPGIPGNRPAGAFRDLEKGD